MIRISVYNESVKQFGRMFDTIREASFYTFGIFDMLGNNGSTIFNNFDYDDVRELVTSCTELEDEDPVVVSIGDRKSYQVLIYCTDYFFQDPEI